MRWAIFCGSCGAIYHESTPHSQCAHCGSKDVSCHKDFSPPRQSDLWAWIKFFAFIGFVVLFAKAVWRAF